MLNYLIIGIATICLYKITLMFSEKVQEVSSKTQKTLLSQDLYFEDKQSEEILGNIYVGKLKRELFITERTKEQQRVEKFANEIASIDKQKVFGDMTFKEVIKLK